MQRSGSNDCMRCNDLCRLEVMFQGRILDKLNIAYIGKSLAADRVADEIALLTQFQAGQIPDRVSIFRAG